ncbi:MAG: hypothetical protein FWH01_03560 [Oscillospiraceae bacterium]|nr:hypothetical protein [Oscillospiraceae bacterium]
MKKTARKAISLVLVLLIALSSMSLAFAAPAPVDKDALESILQQTSGLVESNYTPESWAPFALARSYALFVFGEPAAIQSEVDDAVDGLLVATVGLVAVAPIPAGTTVYTFDQFKAALANPDVYAIILGNSIAAPKSPDPKLVLNRSLEIYGQSYILDLASYGINLEAFGALRVYDITVMSTDKYGAFTAYASPISKAGAWNVEFFNTSFVGSALVGQRTSSVSYGRIDSVTFDGLCYIATLGTAANYAVVYAKDVTIGGAFNMLGENNSIFFKSTDSSGVGTGTNAYGSFVVADGAQVNMARKLSSTTSNTYKDNLIEGYEKYIFNENSLFNAAAGTNLVESNKGYAQTAIIHSGAAKEFTVKSGATVNLVSDASLVDYPATHGSTALSLRKPAGGNLDILVDSTAVLNISAQGTNAYARDFAPVIIGSKVGAVSGTSSVIIKGLLNVNSRNGNGWYYQYIDYSTVGYDSFVVDGGKAFITADGKIGRATSGEYAALEHYGPASFDLEVKNGGEMQIKTNGWRAMSLAGGYLSTIPEKNITVSGGGSKLHIIGGQFAIAAEGKTDFSLNVLNGGYVYTYNTQDSNIYTVGKATYNVIGAGSRLEMIRSGVDPLGKDKTSLYGVIFHDAPLVGPLTINVQGGGNMYAENNFGSRATITTQSHYITDHSINVTGNNSTLTVINNNTGNSAAGDTSLYPVGAIAFAANCSGDINIGNGARFYAISKSPDSPTIALGSYGSSNLTGKLTIGLVNDLDIRNDAQTTNVRAIALRGRNYDPKTNKDTAITFSAASGNEINVWGVGLGTAWPSALRTERFTSAIQAANSAPTPVSPGTLYRLDLFKLSEYGRISARGSVVD